MSSNMPPGNYFDRDTEFPFTCSNQACPYLKENEEPHKWTAPGYVEGDTGAGVLFSEEGTSNDHPPGPYCGYCEHEGDNT